MSVRLMTWVFEHSCSTLSDRLVLLAIADNARDEDNRAWPSIRLLAEKARVSERTAQRAVQNLVGLEELAVEPNAGAYGQNVYKMLTPHRGDKLSPPTDRHPDNLSPGGDNRGGNHVVDVTRTIRENHQEPLVGFAERKAPERASALPDGWAPTAELLDWARRELPGGDLARETDKFRDYWQGRSDRLSRKTPRGWNGAWRNWIRRAAESAPTPAGGPTRPASAGGAW